MLVELRVKNFAIIDEIGLQFKSGFNILSGETGAGKSVLLKSLGLLMGAKASIDLIRDDADNAIIEGQFDIKGREDIKSQLEEMGIDCSEDDLVVRRIVGRNGKSKVYLNSSLSTVAGLNKVVHPLIQLTGGSAPLIEITGQHESKNLLDRSYHLDILDLFAGLFPERKNYQELYQKRMEISEQIDELIESQKMNEQKLDFLSFQIREIESMDLEIGEEETLESNYKKVKNSQKLQDFFYSQKDMLEDNDASALNRIQKAKSLLEQNLRYDDSLAGLAENLERAEEYLSEYLIDLNSYQGQLESSDLDMLDIEERLSRFRKLQKKYGESAEEILNQLDVLISEKQQIENFDNELSKLQKEKLQLDLSLKQLAQKLSKTRIKAAKNFTEKVNTELKDLNMNGFEFAVSLEKLKDLDRRGMDDCSFVCKTAAAESARALHKTASGGELSRILLSLKKVIGSEELPRTYLFDEVDTGVSGETAEKVGKKLHQIANGQQLICVTHLPQVAAQGEHHYRIEKTLKNGRAIMSVSELSNSERIDEIARLISGEKRTKTSLKHAKELLSLNI